MNPALGAPWFHLSEGNTLCGTLLGVYERSDRRIVGGKLRFFQVRLLEPCDVRRGGEDAVVDRGQVGEVVNIAKFYRLESLEKVALDITRGAEYSLHVTCGK